MKYKLIATDLDGTLLNDDKKITNKTQEILLEYQKLGYLIVGVTARTIESVKNVITLNIFDYLILNNGAHIYNVKMNFTKEIGYIDKNTMIQIINLVDKASKQIDFASITTYYTYKTKKNSKLNFIKDIDNIDEINENVARMNLFLSNSKNIEYYLDLIKNTFNNVNCFIMQDSKSDEKWLVINPKELNKKSTLTLLGNELKITLDEMIFFGDGLNDLEVIQAVGCGVAMDNALDIIKKNATYTTLSNNDDGVGIFIQSFLPKKH